MNRQKRMILAVFILVLVGFALTGCADKPKQQNSQATAYSGVEDVFLPDEGTVQAESGESRIETPVTASTEAVEETAIHLPMIPMG